LLYVLTDYANDLFNHFQSKEALEILQAKTRDIHIKSPKE